MKLTHPDSKQTIETTPERAEMYFSQGWREATEGAPKPGAKLADWQDFARTQGLSDEDIDGKTRDELRAALS